MHTKHFVILLTLIFPLDLLAQTGSTQPKPLPVPPSPATQKLTVEPLPPGWEEIDQRFLFLVEQLMLVESEINATTKALASANYKQAIQQRNAERAEKGSEIMDRRGGGPVDWWSFYGKTAEKFFYHPNGQRDFYRTSTVLVQRASIDEEKEGKVAAQQGVPVHQRPPQFDYFYRANEKAKARAEEAAAAIGKNIEGHLALRRQREAKQAQLWCLLSLRGVTRLELSRKPIYRFELAVPGTDAVAKERQEVLSATSKFIRSMNRMLIEAQDAVDWRQEGETFKVCKALIADNQRELDNVLLKQPSLIQDLENKRTAIGFVDAASKRLVDASQNLVDAQAAIVEKDANADDLNKQRHRAILQQAIFDVASNIHTLDQCFQELAKDWNAKPDIQKSIIAPVGADRLIPLPAIPKESETSELKDPVSPKEVAMSAEKERQAAPPVEGQQVKGAVDHVFDPRDWRVWCWTGKKWVEHPLNKMKVDLKDGVLRAKNTTGIHTRAILIYKGATLDGDFVASVECRGTIESFDLQAASGDNAYFTIQAPAMGTDWRRLELVRSNRKVLAKVDNDDLAARAQAADGSVRGYFAIKLRNDQEVEIRNFELRKR